MVNRISRTSMSLVLMLLATTTQATNMGFQLDLEIPVVDPRTGSQNFFFLAYPLRNGLPDVGTEVALGPGETACASLPGEFVPDGVVTLADVLCDTWTMLPELEGSELATVQYIDPSDCSWVALALNVSPFFGASFAGALGVELQSIRELGLLLQFAQSAPGVNRPRIVGSHDPSYAGFEFPDPMDCSRIIINPVYHSLYETTTEIYCGLEGVDWEDRDLNGVPDSCLGGIYDNTTFFALQYYRNEPGDFGFVAAAVNTFLSVLTIQSEPIELAPGQAYLLSMEPTASPNDFVQPHY